MNENSAENSCIDFMKLIASIMIFALHCRAFSDLGRFSFLWELLTRWGVPYFFIASSYFLFSRCNHSDSAKMTRKYVCRIAILYSVWFVINLPSTYFNRLYGQDMSSIGTWILFIKNSILSYTYTGSWYLVSCMFCAVAITFLSKYFSTRMIICISSVIQILCIFSSAYAGAFPAAIQSGLEFLCFPLNIFGGLFYFSIGKWIAEKKDAILKMSRNRLLLIFVCAYFLYFMEIYLSKKAGLLNVSDQAFFLIPVSISLFVITLQSTITLKNAKTLRKISTIIFCAQGNVVVISTVLRVVFHIESSLLRFICSCAVMTMIVVLICILQKQRKHKWVQYFT